MSSLKSLALALLLYPLSLLAQANELALTQGDFHWLRPWWLAAILPALLICAWLWRQQYQAQQWQQLVAPELLPHLLDGKSLKPRPWKLLALLLGWTIACLALAGPTWEKRNLPVQKNQNAMVILFDLSPSMMSEDLKPSRLVRAHLKLIDILRERRDGLTGLLVYGGEAHAVVPLTDDSSTIQGLVAALHPDLMPKAGSNIEAAVKRALEMLADGGAPEGELLLITDGVAESALPNIRRQLQASRYRLSVLGVGGDVPAPIPSARGNFVRDAGGNIVTTRLEEAPLQKLAQQNNGRYTRLTSDTQDVQWLLSQAAQATSDTRELEREFDNWYDRGHWLVFLLLPLVLYCFRRGLLVVLLCIPASLLYAPQSQALSWKDVWSTKDQQAQRALEAGDAATAAQTFTDPLWQASAHYRAGNYEAAAEGFAQFDNAEAHYNRGNALARKGELEQALTAYDQALQRQPEFPEAQANRDLVERLLEQQQQEQQNQENQQEDSSDQQNAEDQQDSNNPQESDNQQEADGQQSDQQQPSDQQQSDDQSAEHQQEENQQGSSATDEQTGEDTQPVDEQESGQEEQQQQTAEQVDEQSENQSEEDQREENPNEQHTEQQVATEPSDQLSDEQRQALEQWLRRVPDDPAGLLRNKFRYEHRQQLRQGRDRQSGQQEERW